MSTLIIVESPTKAKAISGYAGPGHVARATFGHFRDLPKDELGVDLEDGSFRPHYRITSRKTLQILRAALAKADTVVLASDPDREGEAIAWHVTQALKKELKGKKVVRSVFHEITPQAVRAALAAPRAIDQNLVDAQQARRVLDRLVGYKISPILWKDFRPDGKRAPKGLSAGRVQSVALRLVVEREQEIENFIPQEYWTLDALLSQTGPGLEKDPSARFKARLAQVGKEKADLKTEAETQTVIADLKDVGGWQVSGVQRKTEKRNPSPPYTTSSLQQDASARLGWAPKKTMQVAQQLFEGLDIPDEGHVGLITYMRTDSVHIAPEAQAEARQVIQTYWPEGLPSEPPVYKSKIANAQEAHEAIRPTSVLRSPKQIAASLSPEQSKLYELVWRRLVASQMKPAVYDVTIADVRVTGKSGQVYLFRATARKLVERGYLAVYSNREAEDEEHALPPLQRGDALDCHELIPEQHFTEPPGRYSEAGLVKELEKRGIGRPSTYASILATIQERGYIEKQGKKALAPTLLGRQVCAFLLQRFPDIFDYSFTARMEDHLDEVANGEVGWKQVMGEFWSTLEPRLSSGSWHPASSVG